MSSVVRTSVTWIGQTGQALKSGEFIRPVYGAGIDYRFSYHWGLNIEWLKVSGKYSDQLPTSQFYRIGAFYKF